MPVNSADTSTFPVTSPVNSAVKQKKQAPESFKIKSAHLQAVALMIKTTDWSALTADLTVKFGPQGETPDFFDHDALILDFSNLDANLPVQDFAPLLTTLKACRLVPVAVRAANASWVESARSFGLVEAPVDMPRLVTTNIATNATTEMSVPAEITHPEMATPVAVVQELPHKAVNEVLGTATMVIDKPLRSGQKIYARGADLVILAMVNQGAEVVADGNIHVYAPLRGRAMAGASGNVHARIFSTCLEPELISIAGIYRTSEKPLADGVRGKAAQVRLSNDGQDKLLIEALKT
ncbi:MAG: septum site-determining protein MinC [Burkholderiaceae bacterium]